MKITSSYLLALLTFAIVGNAMAQERATYQRKGYTLTFANNDATLDSSLQHKLIETFFKVYPKIAKEYNKQTLKTVAFVVDTAYKGVAATSNGRVVFNPKWFHQHPEDIDVVTHEVMHIAQDYKRSVGPGWLTEGIADYVRNQFGVNNEGAKWKLPDYKAGQSYTNSYRITARFLYWIEKKQNRGIVKELDKQLRERTYTADSWKQQTGKTLDELWQAYIDSPAV
ncbi:basic secretory protein-like protein [Mucilaginibacter sp. PAMB04168]|uniref:basic secretory protein-like protein n=1 Tax=Mucilaginibacter sp. PAMB04168 TaxID=3138567 RepID=UPI0031F68A23